MFIKTEKPSLRRKQQPFLLCVLRREGKCNKTKRSAKVDLSLHNQA